MKLHLSVVQIERGPGEEPSKEGRMIVMTTHIANFERVIDRVIPGLFMGLGAIVAVALATLGA